MSKSLSSVHPSYSNVLPDWELMRHSYKGQREVKSKGPVYLSMTPSQILDGADTNIYSVGYKAYEAYKSRARFPNFVREAIQNAIGMMHSQPPTIKLPKAMEGIMSRRGEKLPDLLRRINTEQILTGRIGLMADMPSTPSENSIPYLATYAAERIVNWDNGTVEDSVPQILNLVVLDESEHVRDEDGFSWEEKKKYRVLQISDGIYYQAVFEEDDYDPSLLQAPSWKGTELGNIPFIIINSCDVTDEVDDPPLLDLGNMCITIYQTDADYRHNLFMQGQDTLVTIGGNFDEDQKLRVGANARIDLPTNGDAKYIGVESTGLAEQKNALDTLESRAGTMGAQTLDSTSRQRESGDSLRIRVAARTADMNQIAETGAEGLQKILRLCARWMGEDENEVIVIPNKEFGEMPLTGQTMVEISTARNLGWPISAKSMHDLSRRRRLTSKTFEEEVSEATEEKKETEFVFAAQSTGDRTSSQPNANGNPAAENIKGQDTNPKNGK
jgi:hypothetical protein